MFMSFIYALLGGLVSSAIVLLVIIKMIGSMQNKLK